jgi:GNAT superfamily N-acetyltransferase
MSSTSKIPRAPTYLLSRLPSSSVLTLSPTASLPDPPPLAWILTGAHGSLSTLYVLPSHRRLGLAKHVVAHRMRAMSRHGDKLRPWCCVEDGGGNVASEGVWKSLGWEKRERGCYWVALGKLWAM